MGKDDDSSPTEVSNHSAKQKSVEFKPDGNLVQADQKTEVPKKDSSVSEETKLEGESTKKKSKKSLSVAVDGEEQVSFDLKLNSECLRKESRTTSQRPSLTHRLTASIVMDSYGDSANRVTSALVIINLKRLRFSVAFQNGDKYLTCFLL